MKSLTADALVALHRLLTDTSGGSHGLRDRGLLESAAASPYQVFGGVEAYPTLAEKAARLCYALVANHSFVDGNKRIGVLAMLTLLELNGEPIRPSDDALVALGLGAAAGELSYADILAFIKTHRQDHTARP